MENPILSGRFTSDGLPKTIQMPADIDWMRVYNYTAAAQTTKDLNATFYWQRGMADGTGIVYVNAQDTADNPMLMSVLTAPTGFYPIASADQEPGAKVAITNSASSAQVAPVFATGTTPSVGDIVRLSSMTGNQTLGGVEFSVTAISAGVSFTLGSINTAGAAAVTAGNYRIIPYDPVFYPRSRTISYITPSDKNSTPLGSTRIYTTVQHGYQVGQKVNLQFQGGSAIWGNYAQLNNQSLTITAINTASNSDDWNEPTTAYNFDVAYDSAGYLEWIINGANEWLVEANYPQPMPTVVPVGQNTAYSISAGVSVDSDSVDNQAIVGIKLSGGEAVATTTAGPAGSTGDVMYWVAGSSFDVNNE